MVLLCLDYISKFDLQLLAPTCARGNNATLIVALNRHLGLKFCILTVDILILLEVEAHHAEVVFSALDLLALILVALLTERDMQMF